MIAQTASPLLSARSGTAPLVGQTMTMRTLCLVQLYDRRTGRAHRVNGTPVVIYTRNPAAAVENLLEGRNAALWEARVAEIETLSAP